jgi:simple sugar transport system substrate-binding protein
VVDRKIETETDGLYTAFIGANFHNEGVIAGEWMVARFANTDRTIRVAEISGTPDSSPTIGRYEGIREVFADNTKFEIVFSETGDFMRSRGREVMMQILQETPDIDILYAHNDDMALGAIEIMEEQGIRPGIDIIIVSVDAQTSGLEALLEGKINCLIECSPYVGNDLMSLVMKILNNEPFDIYTYTYTRVFTELTDPNDLPIRPEIIHRP